MSTSAFVTLVGRANAGKSTLLNALVGEKIAAVTSKPQTTRTRIRGIVTKGDAQYVFADTPGLHRAKTLLGSHLNRAASARGADLAVLVADATKRAGEPERLLIKDFAEHQKAILLLNKIDLLPSKSLVAHRIAEYSGLYGFEAVIPVSALKNDGLDLVWDEVKKHSVPSPHLFPDDALTDRSRRYLAGEIIREKIMFAMRDEVPHGTAVVVEAMAERTGASGEPLLDITAVIYCERETHKGMLIGKKGSVLKRLGELSRLDLERLFGIKVNLQCRVKVSEDWRNKDGKIRDFGLSS
jgi:GTP-binding protein Era